MILQKKPSKDIKTLGGFNLVPSGIPFAWFSPSFCKNQKRPTLCKKSRPLKSIQNLFCLGLYQSPTDSTVTTFLSKLREYVKGIERSTWNSDIRMKRETMMFRKTLRRPDQEFSVTGTSVYLA